MGEWTTFYEDKLEGRLVTVKVYQSGEATDEDGDEGPAVRVTTTSVNEHRGVLEEEGGDIVTVEREDAGRLVTLEPYSLDDLEGELMEVRFGPEAAALIASKVPV